MLTFQRIEELAGRFPGLESSTSYGTPALKVTKKLVLRMHQSEDAIVLILGSVSEQKQHIEDDPMSFYITDHYLDYPAVLIRPTVSEVTFLELLERSWRRVARKQDLAIFESR
ncbi:MAG: hypothetical protein NXH85_15915 [Pseudomonadaceae bacterium]|nr:hypothetical protein [Pseudomonadaceae bacterium]